MVTEVSVLRTVCVCFGVILVLFLCTDWDSVVSLERWTDKLLPNFEHEQKIVGESTKEENVKGTHVARTPTSDGPREDNTSDDCSPRKNFVFMKVHKAGSSTTTPIVARYALRQNCTVMFPLARGTLSWPNLPRVDDYIHRPDEKYSVLFHHTVYNKEWMESKFPANTAYLAIIREPFSHLKSCFNYYRLDRILPFKNKTNPLREFLRNPAKYHTSVVLQGILVDNTRNAQAFDMGYPIEKAENMESGRAYIQQLGRDFTLVLILEYLDHSLVMLKRLMCWETRDILYATAPRNSKTYPYKSYQPTDAERETHRQWSQVDYAMYDHFNQTLWRKIKEQGPDFYEELAFFRQVNQDVNDFCSRQENHGKGQELPATKHFPKSLWSNAFDFNHHSCTLLSMDYSGIDTFIREAQDQQMLKKPCEQQKVVSKPNLYFVLDGRPAFNTLGDVMNYKAKKDTKPLNREQAKIIEMLKKSFQKCKKKQEGMEDFHHEVAGKFKVKSYEIPEEMLGLPEKAAWKL
ncbi:PREDICTED: galactosylceramide sulfotransferase-like [Branchiostoma belcheri]|uniref:Galactosylceramide sulfotransferase-like n=1 Tax=Branchiostoma belcheri TaxID=7741 RepID=A0A6P4ZEL4_BRABE|nr:PREDICTED: galactosylceramide sulfotransferase-like [Branchiostoma belcheri]